MQTLVELLPSSVVQGVFSFFFLGCTGWVLETIQETLVRKQFVNKGFFKGPFVLSHAIGGMLVSFIGSPFKAYPALVFLAGLVVCTCLEYSIAIFLERCFKVKCWDYTTYPHTKWCHYKGRICLTISLFFGIVTLFVVYVYGDFIRGVAALMGTYLVLVDAFLLTALLIDGVFTCTKLLRAKKAGIKIRGYAVFSDNLILRR
ncbi:MAG: putative ABC transporter permease [Treponema sp.]|jgi:uncharacterized membrane protein|nr:putative ABC transporter permease [Treponema sp.]